MNTDEESSEVRNPEVSTTIVLSSEPVFSQQQTEETIPDSPASPSSGQQSIFARFREMEKKNEVLKIATYSEFWK